MLSPMMTVAVLAVLWLIVVVPMLVKRKDDRAGARSIARFGSAMQSLSVRRTWSNLARPVPSFDDDLEAEHPVRRFTRPQVFVPGLRSGLASRAPQPAAMEAIMHPDRVATADLSQARLQMMARRRRSLITLGAGTLIGVVWMLASGGALPMLLTVAFSIGLFGYLYFLRSQAQRDQARREARLRRTATASRSYRDSEKFVDEFDSAEITLHRVSDRAVRIDDDDVALLGMAETIDLTGLYSEEFSEQAMRRAV